jgi:hypothetical protein
MAEKFVPSVLLTVSPVKRPTNFVSSRPLDVEGGLEMPPNRFQGCVTVSLRVPSKCPDPNGEGTAIKNERVHLPPQGGGRQKRSVSIQRTSGESFGRNFSKSANLQGKNRTSLLHGKQTL